MAIPATTKINSSGISSLKEKHHLPHPSTSQMSEATQASRLHLLAPSEVSRDRAQRSSLFSSTMQKVKQQRSPPNYSFQHLAKNARLNNTSQGSQLKKGLLSLNKLKS